jgi:hypothetical protein
MKRKRLVAIFVALLLPLVAIGFERRKPQFPDESSYLILPMPYSLPGIGSGVMYTALAANIADTYTDLFAISVTGDAEGTVLGFFDFHILNELLVLDVFANLINDASQQYYAERGMTAGKDEFSFQEVSKYDYRTATLTLTLFDRRFELYGGYQTNRIDLVRIKDNEGELILEFADPVITETKTTVSGVVLDITDDRADPRRGFRIEAYRNQTPPSEDKDPDYFVDNISASIYLPIGDDSTWAFNYQTSDAVVSREGISDPNLILIEEQIPCPYALCPEDIKTRVDSISAARKNGTARTLGGDQLMRAFPQGRFAGAHMLYYSSEFRWNFVTDVIPISFWIWEDIATSMQLAFFHEVGSVSELAEKLGEEIRSCSGLGFRMVSASGFVYRADYAFSDEESATTVMVQYPW